MWVMLAGGASDQAERLFFFCPEMLAKGHIFRHKLTGAMTTQLDTSAVVARGQETGTLGRYRWLVCGLLFFATTINYMDRRILALLKPFPHPALTRPNAQ